MTRKAETIVTLAILCSISVFIGWLSQYGPAHRTYLGQSRTLLVERPFDAYGAWAGASLKGRVGYVFDARLNARSDAKADPAPENFIYKAATGSILREVHHVMPASNWPRTSAALSTKKIIASKGDGTFRMTIESTPLIISELGGVRLSADRPLMLINTDAWSEAELADILKFMAQAKPDLMIVTGRSAQDTLTRAGIPYDRQ